MTLFHKLFLVKNIWRFCSVLVKDNKTRSAKQAEDVIKYLNHSGEYVNIIDNIPKALLRKYKTPENMYLVNKTTAKHIANTLKNYLDDKSPVIEVNPGLCFLSKELLQTQKHLYLYEMSNSFSQHLNNLQTQYPNQVTFKIADFFGMWKLAFQDKMDDGNRIEELLGELATDDHDRSVNIVGSIASLSFVRHLINNIVFQSSSRLGRPALYLAVPAHHHRFLTDANIQLSHYKTVPALFQLLFQWRELARLPRDHFLPWTHGRAPRSAPTMPLEDELYLVQIRQRSRLPCPPEYLPLLWYFFRPHVFSKSTRIIPMLEQWIPGCGVWLITGQDPPDSNPALTVSADDARLPHMTIFTTFGDLNLQQKLTVFKKFISWPEFEQCPFRTTMESHLPKLVAPPHDEHDDCGTHVEHDDAAEHDAGEHDDREP